MKWMFQGTGMMELVRLAVSRIVRTLRFSASGSR